MTRRVSFVTPSSNPHLVAGAIARFSLGFPANLEEWREQSIARIRGAFESRPPRGAIAVTDAGEAVAFSTWESVQDSVLGESVSIVCIDPGNAAAMVEEIVAEVCRLKPGGRLILRLEILQGSPPTSDLEELLSRYQLEPRTRGDYRFDLNRISRLSPGKVTFPMRNLGLEDESALAKLLEEAYAADPAERALFAQRSDPREEARTGVHGLLRGGVGDWLPWASFGVTDSSRIVGATLVNQFHGPLISEVMVSPEFRRRGIARALLVASLRSLASHGAEAARLVASRENTNAVQLYESVGFSPDPGVEGVVWVNPGSLRRFD